MSYKSNLDRLTRLVYQSRQLVPFIEHMRLICRILLRVIVPTRKLDQLSYFSKNSFLPSIAPNKSRFPLFIALASTLSQSRNKRKWKQAATLNGVPYILGHVPTTSSMTHLGGRGKKERERVLEGWSKPKAE